jgi:hypothetical protein
MPDQKTHLKTLPFYDRSAKHLILLGSFALFAYVESFMFPEAHWHRGLLGGTVYLLVLLPVLAWLFYASHRQWVIRCLSSGIFWAAVIVLVAGVDQRHFLHNQLLPDPGSTAKGLELPARALLLHGHELYSVDAIGTPVSPGPGWILMWSPITIPGWTGILEAISLSVAAWLMYRRHRLAAGVFCLLMLILPLYYRIMSGGQDLWAISLAFVALGIVMDNVDSDLQIVLIALLAGTIATSRVPMFLPVTVLGFGLYRKNPRAGMIFLPIMLATAMAWHFSFAAIAHHAGHLYQPLHVLRRAGRAGTWNRVAAAVLCIGCFGWCYKKMTGDVRTWLIGAFLMMVVLFAPTGIAEGLHDLRWDWEGAGYITFPMPLLVAAIALYIRRQAMLPVDAQQSRQPG